MAIEAKEAVKKAHEIIVDFAKQIATTSAAILALFASLVSGKVISLSGYDLVVLTILFAALILCILFTFWLILSVAGTLDAVGFPERSKESLEASKYPSIYRSNIRMPLFLVMISFIFGLIILLVIVIL